MGEKEKKAADKMRRLCSRREYCVADIRKKLLKELESDADAVGKVLEALVAEKYVDDLRYASAYARDKSGLSGWGVQKIRYSLMGKGIAREVIAQALEEVDSEKAAEKLERLLKNKYVSLEDDPQCRLKLLRFALGRGYEYDEVMDVVNRLTR